MNTGPGATLRKRRSFFDGSTRLAEVRLRVTGKRSFG